MALVSIVGLDKAEVLAALYNASRPQGLGFMHYTPEPMTREEAQRIGPSRSFDYLQGRVMKVDLAPEGEIETRLYDRDNGEGAGARAVAELRAGKGANSAAVREAHKEGVLAAAQDAREVMRDGPERHEGGATAGPIRVVTIGLADVAADLAPKVEEAVNAAADGPDVIKTETAGDPEGRP